MIELKEVAKYYNGRSVFENVSLKLDEGKITTFVGHNGCGKTTLLRVISGLVKKDDGLIIYPEKYRFSYVPDKMPALPMSANSYLKHMLEIEGLGKNPDALTQMKNLADEFFVSNMLDKKMNQLSKGTLQKIGVIQALMAKSDVLLLDEPLSGQDADSREVFMEKIMELKKHGTIILLAAHEPDLIQSLSDEIYGIFEGKVIPYEEKPKTGYVIWVPGRKGHPEGNDLQKFAEDCGLQSLSEIHSIREGLHHQNIETNTRQTDMEYGLPSEDDNQKGYILKTDEEMLYLDIKRLQKEGWHIGKVYEDNTDY